MERKRKLVIYETQKDRKESMGIIQGTFRTDLITTANLYIPINFISAILIFTYQLFGCTFVTKLCLPKHFEWKLYIFRKRLIPIAKKIH